MGIPGGETSSMICLAVMTQYRSLTYGRGGIEKWSELL